MYMYMSAVNVPKNKVKKVELNELGGKNSTTSYYLNIVVIYLTIKN